MTEAQDIDVAKLVERLEARCSYGEAFVRAVEYVRAITREDGEG